MKTDLYTKCVLTVIAIALCYLAVQQTLRPTPVHAADSIEIPILHDHDDNRVVPVMVFEAQTRGYSTYYVPKR